MDEAASKAGRIRARRGNKWRRSRTRPKSTDCSRNEMVDEAVSKAERIRASRGNYEAEVSCTGERGLHQCLIMCKKNPGHQNFIPTEDFNIDHLPSRYRDNDIVDMVRATSDVTCRLSVSCISEDRPETWPDSDQAFPFSAHKGENTMMTGTGWVCLVRRFVEENDIDCQCEECCRPGTQTSKKTWGEVQIRTARHVVYDDEEARHTRCQFFYDSHETDINEVLTLTGLKVSLSDTKGDWCEMEYVTHDIELLNRFDKMYRRWQDLYHKLYEKYGTNKYQRVCAPGAVSDPNISPDLCIVVSHPHGCTKQVAVGTWTQRHVVDKHSIGENTTYNYNTPTCPGSSGASVITMCADKMKPDWFYHFPPHSQGRPDNDNNSGLGWERLT